jgi:hypothetical protein
MFVMPTIKVLHVLLFFLPIFYASNGYCAYNSCSLTYSTTSANTTWTVGAGTAKRQCLVQSFLNHEKKKLLQKHVVFMIGDSFDWHGCYQLRVSSTGSTSIPNVNNMQTRKCFQDNNLVVYFYRIHTIIDEKRMVQENITALLDEMAVISPDTITFGSVAWNLLALHRNYCYQHEKKTLNTKCFCNVTMMNTEACAPFNTYQLHQSVQTPWCYPSAIQGWIDEVERILFKLRQTAPFATIFVRNQPVSSSIFMGNSFCQTQVNSKIRNLVERLRDDVLRPVSPNAVTNIASYCNLLDVRSLLASSPGALGTYRDNQDARSPRDNLHYWDAKALWVDYILNTIIENTALVD